MDSTVDEEDLLAYTDQEKMDLDTVDNGAKASGGEPIKAGTEAAGAHEALDEDTAAAAAASAASTGEEMDIATEGDETDENGFSQVRTKRKKRSGESKTKLT